MQIGERSQNQAFVTDLVECALDGDRAAFEQIMIYSQQRVLAMTWRMLGNEPDARDAAQEVFLRIFKYLKRLDPKKDFFAWVYSITVNVCRDFANRRQKHGGKMFSLDYDDSAFELASDAESADENLVRDEQRKMIGRAIASLPEREKAAIVLRDFEGLPSDEVAAILGSSPTTVRSQISSARRKIKIYCDRRTERKTGEENR